VQKLRYLNVPEKRMGSWGMMASLERSSCKGTWVMSTSSMTTCPLEMVKTRNSASTVEDLPLPVRPHTPTYGTKDRESIILREEGCSTRWKIFYHSLHRHICLEYVQYGHEPSSWNGNFVNLYCDLRGSGFESRVPNLPPKWGSLSFFASNRPVFLPHRDLTFFRTPLDLLRFSGGLWNLELMGSNPRAFFYVSNAHRVPTTAS
jgi:hypothetical protein